MKLRYLVFDLDDTLLDTSQQLIPAASRESCEAMIQAGLNATIELCLQARDELVKTPLRYDLYHQLVQRFGVRDEADGAAVTDRGYHAFHDREVESDISLIPGAREMLVALGDRYELHLVTAGNRPTQEQKIQLLDLTDFFKSIHHVDPTQGETKQNVFSSIMNSSRLAPEKHLSIGNRLDTDIGEAKRLGWMTCWVRHGEYSYLKPADDFERADFEISQITELVRRCQL
jgi:FMN phosphatase YigB (HAD superfamily)